jgi:hypothetical protein
VVFLCPESKCSDGTQISRCTARFACSPPNISFKISAQTQTSKYKIKQNSKLTPNAQLISSPHTQAAQCPLPYLLKFPILHLASNPPLYQKDERAQHGNFQSSKLIIIIIIIIIIILTLFYYIILRCPY